MFEVFRSRRMAALLMLGFSSGIPLFLTQRTLQAWLKTSGVSLSTIGYFGLIGLPYSLKFLWAPIVDRYSLPLAGRRKGWLLATQLTLLLVIAATSFLRPERHLQWIAIAAFGIAFFSATQDITVDAYRAD